MSQEVLLTMVVPAELERHIEDLLLSMQSEVKGFTSSVADGHGKEVDLVDLHDLVTGHARRVLVRTIGSEANMRAVLSQICAAIPNANIYYWLTPVIESGRI